MSDEEYAQLESGAQPQDRSDAQEDDSSEVNLFGLKLEVSNPRLAELLAMDAKKLLTMDAKTALTTDVMELTSVGQHEEPASAGLPAQASVLDVVLEPPSPKEQIDAKRRSDFLERVAGMGEALGFDVHGAGLWTSATGLTIITRAVEKPVSFAAASHFVEELAGRREELAGADSTALFVVDSQQTADVFKVAIRQRRLYDLMRTVAIDNLSDIERLYSGGAIDHANVAVLLAPIADIDVGEMLSVIRAQTAE